MFNYKESQTNEITQCQTQNKIKDLFDQDTSTKVIQNYSQIFHHISFLLSTNEFNNLIEAFEKIKHLHTDAFFDPSFVNLEIPKIIVNCMKNQKIISKEIFFTTCDILLKTNNYRISNEFIKYGIIDIFKAYYINKEEEILHSLQTFSLMSFHSVAARNKILKVIDIQFFCMNDNQQIAFAAYNLILNLCSFGMPKDNCNYIINILINGIILDHIFAFNLIFQSFYQISFAQEKYWYPLLSDKNIENILIQYFPNSQLKSQILLIMKRIVETLFILPDSLISLLFYFLQSNINQDNVSIFISDEKSIEIISEIFLICVRNWSQIDSLLKFNLIDALLLIAENGNFQSKINSVYCLSKIYPAIISKHKEKEANDFLKKIVEIFIQNLALPQQDTILYILMSIIDIMNNLISQNKVNLIFTAQNQSDLIDELNNLQSNEDSLIVSKAEYLIDLIHSL